MTRISGVALPLVGAVLIAMTVTACSSRKANRGNMPTKEQVETVIPGVHGQDDVRAIMGSPSVVSTFDEDTWYYIGRRTSQYAFFELTTIEQQVLVVRYGDDGRVERINRLDEKDGREIDLVERETPSAGRKLGILEQLFGNIGRFSDGSPGGQ